MRRRTVDLATLLGATLVGNGDVAVSGAATDSRDVRPGDLFVALPGARVDGHTFVSEAVARGAAAALVQYPVASSVPLIQVADTLAALQILATEERRRSTYRLVGVTGSVAKTTTKEILAELMATRWRVGRTRGNRNSEIGLPLELCNQPDGLDWIVAELGMSHAGELSVLGAIARPQALLYTVIAPVHLEFFSGIDAIAEAKAELIPHLAADGVLVLNAADTMVAALTSKFAGHTVRYGIRDASELWIEDWHSRGLRGAAFTLVGDGVRTAVEWRLVGQHQATNLLAAAACAIALGVSPQAIPGVAAACTAPPRRGEVHDTAAGITIVDDSYNASPIAVRSMLALLADTPGRRVAVLGEMLELGAGGPALHEAAGHHAAAAADLVITVGGEGAGVMAASAGTPARWMATTDEAIAEVPRLLRPGDVVLIKGSRGIGLDRLVDSLLGRRG